MWKTFDDFELDLKRIICVFMEVGIEVLNIIKRELLLS